VAGEGTWSNAQHYQKWNWSDFSTCFYPNLRMIMPSIKPSYQWAKQCVKYTLAVTTLLLVLGYHLQARAVAPIQTFILPNQQTVYIQENHTRPIVTIDSWVKTGSVNETTANNGVSHFLEHLLFKGTPTYPAGAIDKLLESHGATFNAATSDDYTHYYITLPSSYTNQAIRLHADMLLNATIPPDELDRERKVVQEEINRADDSPERKLYLMVSERLFAGHGYAYDTLGPKSNIATIPRQSIMDYYHAWYQPQHLNTIITGDVDPATVLPLLQQVFVPSSTLIGASHDSPAITTNTPPAYPKQAQVVVQTDASISQAYVMLGFPGPAMAQRQAVLAMDAAMSILGQGDSSRLVKDLREDKALVSSIGSGNQTQQQAGLLTVSAELKASNLPTVRKALLSAIATLKTKGITQAELDKFKTQTIKGFLFANESTETVANSVGYNVTIGKLADYTRYVDEVSALSVSQVNQALHQWLNPTQSVWVALLPTPKKGEASFNTPAETKATVEGLAQLPTNTSTPPQHSASVSTINTEVLSNGLTLITKPNTSTDTVAIQVFAKGGKASQGVAGVADLTAETWLQGTTHRNAGQLKQLLESSGLGLSATAGDDMLQLSGSSVATDAPLLLSVMADVIANPTFSPSELNKQKSLLSQAIQGSQDSPSTVVGQQLLQALYPNHGYGQVGLHVAKQLPSITQAQVLRFYKASLKPSNVVVSAVGNFDPKALQAMLLQAFGPNKAPIATASNATVAHVAPLASSKTVQTLKASKVAGAGHGATWLAQGWLAPPLGQADQITLKVINSLLGNGLSSRLFVNIREKQGLAYTVASQYPSTKQTGRFVLFIGTDPINEAKVTVGFTKEIERLKTELVPVDELQAAKDKLTGQFALGHETNAEQAYYLGFYQAMGVGHGFDVSYPQLAQRVTPADVQRVAKLVFGAPSVLSVVKPNTIPNN
jgi:zinc protease